MRTSTYEVLVRIQFNPSQELNQGLRIFVLLHSQKLYMVGWGMVVHTVVPTTQEADAGKY